MSEPGEQATYACSCYACSCGEFEGSMAQVVDHVSHKINVERDTRYYREGGHAVLAQPLAAQLRQESRKRDAILKWREAATAWNKAHERAEKQRLVVDAAIETYAQAVDQRAQLRQQVAEAEVALVKLNVPREEWAES